MSSRSSSSSSDLLTWQSARYTLFLRVHSADKLQLSTSLSSYCKLYLGETPVTSSSLTNILIKDQPAQNGQPEHRTFLTKVCTSQSKLSAVWNEKFEIPVDDPKKQILSIRVKSQHQLISPAIGACAIQLKQLRTGQTADQNFPLFKGSTQVGTIRLQLMLRANAVEEKVPIARLVDDAVVVKKTAKKMVKKVRDDSDDEDYDHRPRDSMVALERERRRLEEEEEERRCREREREQQVALEKRRIEEKMEQLRREEEERQRLRAEEEERRRIAAEKLAAEQEEQRLRRQWEQQEEELARRDGHIVNTTPYDNQIDGEKKKPSKDQRPSTRRSTLSLRDMLDMVVQDALPSDSDDSDSEELDTEDEKELIRQIAKLKMQMKKKKKEARQRLRDSENNRKSKTKVVYVYEDDDVERRHKAKSFNDDLYARSPVSKHSKSQGDVLDRNSGTIKSLVPGEFDKKAAKENKKDEKKNKKNKAAQNNNQNDGLTLGQVVQAATSVATLGVGLDDEIGAEVIPDAVDALQNLVPIGRFLGRKLHEATAKVAQMNEKETPSYYF